MTPHELILSILPDAKQGEGNDKGKWYYNEWIIYFGHGYIGNRTTGEKLRFGNLEQFEKKLKQIE